MLGLGAAVKIREKDASLSLKLPGGLGEANEQFCQNLPYGRIPWSLHGNLADGHLGVGLTVALLA